MWIFPLVIMAVLGQSAPQAAPPCVNGKCPLVSTCRHGAIVSPMGWYSIWAQDGRTTWVWGRKCPQGRIHYDLPQPALPKPSNLVEVKPAERKPAEAPSPDPALNGVVREQLSHTERFHVPGPEARAAYDDLVREGKKNPTIQDGRLCLTVSGTDAKRAVVMADLENSPALASLTPQLLVQDYLSTDWPVAGVGLYAARGDPEIVIQQKATGKVVARFDGYPGPEPLAKRITEELRHVNPSYNPARDPSGFDALCPLGFTKDHWPAIVVTVAVAGYLLFPRKRA